MAVMIRQISSLEKVRRTDCLPTQELFRQTALAGQRVSYQICITAEGQLFADVRVRSELAEHIQMYCVKDAVMDEIEKALKRLGLTYNIQKERAYPGKWYEKSGRVLVEWEDTKLELLKEVSLKIKEIRN